MKRKERIAISFICGVCIVAPLTVLGVVLFLDDSQRGPVNGIPISHKLTYGMNIRNRLFKKKINVAFINPGKGYTEANLDKIPVVKTPRKPRKNLSRIRVDKTKTDGIPTAEAREEAFEKEMETRRSAQQQQ